MNIFVCIKSVPVSDAIIKITPDCQHIERTNLKYDLNPYDEYAIEAAVQLKEQFGGNVLAISLTDEIASVSLRRVLAMGADKLIQLMLPAVGLNDSQAVAQLLAQEIRQNPFDLILLGKQAIDTGSEAVGPLIARLLDLPFITAVTNLSVQEQTVIATKEFDGYQAVYEGPLPVVITTEKGLNKPRYPSLKDIMLAKKKEIISKNVALPQETCQIIHLQPPPTRPAGRILGEGPAAVPELVRILKEAGTI